MVALNSSSRSDPDVRLDMSFDYFLFCGRLKQAGYLIRQSRGREVFGIKSYSALSPILGEYWYVRVLNRQHDFCYVLLDTIQFYLYRRNSIVTSFEPLRQLEGGYALVFKFVRGDGVQRQYAEVVA